MVRIDLFHPLEAPISPATPLEVFFFALKALLFTLGVFGLFMAVTRFLD